MIRFADPQYLWLLLLLIPVALIFIVDFLRWRKKVSRIGDAPLVKSMISEYSFRRDVVKRILLLAALALLVVIIARPQMGTRISNEKRNGIEVVVAIDVSNSMLATDVAPSRLDKTKLLVSNMIDRFANDKLGIVVFA
ncbi:MAG: VWA domain-containing protein, partial [Prevotella sp.]|nr:VWA domain-containing protein [Prevotella sp.]